ncbi:hypothetical protein M8998_05795 [Sphingobacterium sp. lm-10]|uniref:hypothetical protein n=1 Tax=Sphingobacterium sp. lm-10 TaxID=2944904 RepID=UPI0020216A38|nr:hypothetical protein [Sphingobacterium sp. lm-10]MCL7987449.1 hypothetical protein [Sphingobacterium sp. lm-10]
MKFYLGIFSLALAITSCQGNADKTQNDGHTQESDTTMVASHSLDNGHYCYIRTEGAENQDTTKVHFVIDENDITGEMDWLPHEKDQRKGTLLGTINGEDVRVQWTYMQEGMQDTLHLQFRLTGGMELYQKPLKVNTSSQREQTDESAAYSLKYAAVDCK